MIRTALIGLALVSLAGAAAARDLGGEYRANGTNFDGSPYSGTASINITSDTTCAITWTTGQHELQRLCAAQPGCVRSGYVMGDSIGLVIYKMMPDGSLNGIWTIAARMARAPRS